MCPFHDAKISGVVSVEPSSTTMICFSRSSVVRVEKLFQGRRLVVGRDDEGDGHNAMGEGSGANRSRTRLASVMLLAVFSVGFVDTEARNLPRRGQIEPGRDTRQKRDLRVSPRHY